MDIFRETEAERGLASAQIDEAVAASLRGRRVKRALLIPPDFTRYHSNAGYITGAYYRLLTEAGAEADVLPALGTHAPMTEAQARRMFPDVPFGRFLVHDWRSDVVRLGEIPGAYLAQVTDGLWREPVSAEINRLVMDERYDLVVSIGQVVPHEVIGMSGHAKNLFVGVGGSDMINKSHMVGAVYGMERMMGRDHTPVRKLFDYGMERFLSARPILFALTVTTAPGGNIRTHGLYIGEGRECLTRAVRLAQRRNVEVVERPIRKCVAYLDPGEFRSTWLGNKAVYRARMAMADGGELLVLAPGVERFGEDARVDALIRKYGYRGRLETLERFRSAEGGDLRENMGAAAHLIHGSTDGRFAVTYAVRADMRAAVEGVGYRAVDADEALRRYPPARMRPGFQTLPDGEEVFFIPNPALGLWIERGRYQPDG